MSIMAAIKAIPALVDGLKEIKQSILYLSDNRTDSKMAEIKAEMRKELETIKATDDREKMLELIHNLNSKLSS